MNFTIQDNNSTGNNPDIPDSMGSGVFKNSTGPSTNKHYKRVCWGCISHVSSCICGDCYNQALYTVTHPDYDPYATDYSSTEVEDDGIIENYCKECQDHFLDKDYDPFEVEWGIELFQELWRTYQRRK